MMLKFQWNALRRGDRVLVHDPGDVRLALRAGVVAFVDVNGSGHDVAIRLTNGSPRPPIRPGRFSVHFDPLYDTASCWRCGELVTA
jgi:hypothetical protein